jgi:hypothetical protein
VDDLEALRQLHDPIKRAKQAGLEQERILALGVELSRIRREAIEEALATGMTKSAIAQELGIARSRVGQLVEKGPAPERLFFGDGAVSVAIGAKLEADKEIPGKVLATEDVMTFTQLQQLLAPLQLDATHELVAPPGIIDLNRSNLVVICGPRLSPMLGQILASDPHLGFAQDEQGWYLRDKTTETDYHSPQDRGENGDVAYFGRLPRPDGHGYFLYLAGIHAAGPAGVIHYLAGALPTLWRQVNRKRFSVLVASTIDPETGQVETSQAVTPVYVHEGK